MIIQVEYPGLNVSWAIIRGVKVLRTEPPAVPRAEEKIKRTWNLDKLSFNPIIRAYRSFFWSLGVDPTKTRPSAEALIRRILRRGRLPRINNVVDAMNAASVETLITLSVFDLNKISLPLRIRAAKGGEKMIAIGPEEFVFPKNFPLMEDAKGAIVAAVIFRDSDNTRVTETTENILVVGYAPDTVESYIVRKAVRIACNYIVEGAGGRLEQ
ncbi:MAG: B3/B4 domain-containing protein [Candidatus Njordarchaeales archaeon]